MKKKLIVHIGTPKTGTSYLQEVCLKNYENLLSAGILYPGVNVEGFTKESNIPINACHILDIFSKDESKQLTCTLLKKHFETVFTFGIETALISDETLSAFNVLNKGNLYIFECLIEVCNSLNIALSFIAYYRKPSKYLPSHWAQLVRKHGETRPLVEFIEQDKIPYWQNLISLYELYNEISVFSYDKEISVDGGLAKSFLDAIGVNPEGFDLLVSESVNPSLSLNSLTALRLINAEFDGNVTRNIENILTNTISKQKLDKAQLTDEMELFVDKLYESELYALSALTYNNT